MIKKPLLNPEYRYYPIKEEGVLVVSSNNEALTLTGEIYTDLLAVIDGNKTSDAIVESLQSQHDITLLFYAINELSKNGLLLEADDCSARLLTPWSLLVNKERKGKIAAPHNQSVAIIAAANCHYELLKQALTNYNVKIVSDCSQASLILLITADFLTKACVSTATTAWKAKTPLLVLNINNLSPSIGPLILPDKKGCFTCLESRVKRLRSPECFGLQSTQLEEPDYSHYLFDPTIESMIYQMAVVEVLKYLNFDKQELHNQVLSIEFSPWRIITNTLEPVYYCECCGEKLTEKNTCAPIELKSEVANASKDGGCRVVTPEEMIKRFKHLVNPICGIVSTLDKVGWMDGIHVYTSGYNAAFQLKQFTDFKKNFRCYCAGKGSTEQQAKASALGEALERYSCEVQKSNFSRLAKYVDMDKENTIHPCAQLLFSESQYRERETCNKKKSRFNYIPKPFNEQMEVYWSPSFSLTHQCIKWVATENIYFALPPHLDNKMFRSCSNGAAAGNTLEEAILQGFFELVERDAVAIWWYNQLQREGVDWKSFDIPYLEEVETRLKEKNRDLWVLDITTDLGIPVFAALSRLTKPGEDRIIFGFGCHLDASIAISRAVCEMNQMLVFEYGETILEDNETLSWLATATLENKPYLIPSNNTLIKTASDYQKITSFDLKEQIERCLSILNDLDLEMLVVDMTREEIRLNVAKVFVPGLRHFWARFAPGRLYDVPVKMGWLEKPLQEKQLNPTPVFF